MPIQSLAYRTDLGILSFEGRVEERDDYVFAESAGNPGFYWGNLLVMKRSPRAGDYAKWLELFRREFAHQPLVRHVTFGWDAVDGQEGITSEFLENGFELERSVVMTMNKSQLRAPARMSAGFTFRVLESDEDWEAAIENQVACRSESFPRESYLQFKRLQMRKYRRMSRAGLGHWYGAFLGSKLVTDCGLFHFDKLGRYQAVGTHPDFRRRGICGGLIHHCARESFAEDGDRRLVIVADPEYHAAKVYESIGFVSTERAIGAYRRPAEDRITSGGRAV